MNQQIQDLLQLYENTIASQGYARREAADGVARSQDDRMGHARWMIDRISQHATRDKWSESKVQREIGIIQGILWSENQFSLRAIEDQTHQLDTTTRIDTAAAIAPRPAPLPPSIMSESSADGDEADVAFAAEMSGATPVSMPRTDTPSAIPVRLPE